ncbi:MAG TPA: excinuclease ABC subunit UvrC [Coxiellaceae bacterium]|nr:MAG: hypothetical protein A3E81_07140 [Gammaproteobacteria bacterium RIFCSPHIGHO2_12_FULL_36_30]HLB56399.1 excinuclease ABC subunit UvrC [Coxiellaceae bacterium]
MNVPSTSGVYRFLDSHKKIIYVGKARNLKKRIASYFRTNLSDKKTAAMMQHVSHLEFAITADEDQALLLECHLIKELHPKYNILMRDDKSYPYLLLSADEFPRLDYYRGKKSADGKKTKKEKGRYFGPYPSAGSVRDNLAIIQKLFQLRSCNNIFFNNRSRPCLQYQINRCTAPCVKYVTKENYGKQVENATLFLEGKNKEMLRAIKLQMETASKNQDYETAAHLRDVLFRLKKLQVSRQVASVAASREWISIPIVAEKFSSTTEKNPLTILQNALNLPNLLERIECFDISHTMGESTKASCVVFGADGAIKNSYRQFNIDNITKGDDYAAMRQVLTRRYTRLKTENKSLPDLIIIDGGKGQLRIAAEVLENLQISGVILLGVAKGVTRKAGVEKLIVWGRDKNISLSTDDPARLFIQRIRDEAHRFAITAHRKARSKNSLRR